MLTDDVILMEAYTLPRPGWWLTGIERPTTCYFCGEETTEDDCDLISGKLVCKGCIASIKEEGDNPEEEIRKLIN
ncbi:MAG: hypothetical protein MR298_01885 [Odoribacter sp.]|nr:hypothetical protein [Odoribacter sp.]